MSCGHRWAQASFRAIIVLFAFLLLSPSLFAYPVAWEFAGTITNSAGPSYDVSAALPIGTPVRIVVSFDTDETPSNVRPSSDGRPGFRYEYIGADSVSIAIFGGACNPCQPNFISGNNNIQVRDDFADPSRNPPPDLPRDGFTFGVGSHPDNENLEYLVIVRDLADAFDPPIVDVGMGGNPLPIEPDARLTQMAEAAFVIQDSVAQGQVLQAQLNSVAFPTLGTYYFLGSRHCLYADDPAYTGGFRGDDCFAGPGLQNRVLTIGGGLGLSNYNETVMHSFPTPDTEDAPGAVDPLGTMFGAIDFTGPLGLPVLRGSSFPSDLSRTNSNLSGFQQYNFNGSEATPLELVVNVDYSIQSDSAVTYYPPENEVQPGAEIGVGLRAGSAGVNVILAVVDASMISSVILAAQDFGSVLCGAEDELLLPDNSPWPPGSIVGAARFLSPANQQGAQSAQLEIRACDGDTISTEPVIVSPGDSFFLTALLQTPARGKLAEDGSSAATNNGFIDAANTIEVIPDPDAPAEVLEQLLSGISAACEDCGPPKPEIPFKDGFE